MDVNVRRKVGVDVPEYMELAVHRISWSSVAVSLIAFVLSDEEQSQSLEDVKDASSSVVEESKDVSKEEGFGSSRRVDTNEGRAVPFFC